MSNRLPTTVAFDGKEVPLYTFEQLSQQPRLKLKNRAMDLRDLIGEDRVPPLRAAGSIESVTMWILEVESALCKAAGMAIEVSDLGLPANFGMEEEQNLINHAKAAPRQVMAEPSGSRSPSHTRSEAAAAAEATIAAFETAVNDVEASCATSHPLNHTHI